MLKIDCEQYDFSSLAAAFEGVFTADCDLSCEVVIVGESEILRLNSENRNISKVTDVLSFPTLDGIFGKPIERSRFPYDMDEEGALFIGSIAVCEKRAKQQAEEYGHSFNRELNYLVTHGILHLLGYDHIQAAQKELMREKEEYVLSKINLARVEE